MQQPRDRPARTTRRRPPAPPGDAPSQGTAAPGERAELPAGTGTVEERVAPVSKKPGRAAAGPVRKASPRAPLTGATPAGAPLAEAHPGRPAPDRVSPDPAAPNQGAQDQAEQDQATQGRAAQGRAAQEQAAQHQAAQDWAMLCAEELAAIATDREVTDTLARLATSVPAAPPPAATPAPRRGPRPLFLHLALAAAPPGASGLPGASQWPAAPGLPAMAMPDPALLAGILAYRRHPYRRDVPEPAVLWREGGSRLLDHGRRGDPPVLVVPSLVNRATVLDLRPGRSLLRWLAGQGLRPLLLDWGWPGEAERRFGLDEYVGRLGRAQEAAGPAALLGYCMGGLLCVAAAQLRPALATGLALLATPWDFHAPDAARGQALAGLLPALEPLLAATGTLTVDALQAILGQAEHPAIAARYRAFATLDQDGARDVDFVALEDWLADGVPLAAPVARACLGEWYGANTPAHGTWRVAGTAIRPEALALPCLAAIPGRDRVVPAESALPLAARLAGCELLRPRAGHVGMIAGAGAEAALWEPLRDWLLRHAPVAPRRRGR